MAMLLHTSRDCNTGRSTLTPSPPTETGCKRGTTIGRLDSMGRKDGRRRVVVPPLPHRTAYQAGRGAD